MSKLYFLAGLGAGYILGAKAGREQYRKIADAAKTTWEKPAVQRMVNKLDEAVDKKVPLLHSVAETALTPADESSGSSSSGGDSSNTSSSSSGSDSSNTSSSSSGSDSSDSSSGSDSSDSSSGSDSESFTADGTPFSVGSDGTSSGAEGDQYRG